MFCMLQCKFDNNKINKCVYAGKTTGIYFVRSEISCLITCINCANLTIGSCSIMNIHILIIVFPSESMNIIKKSMAIHQNMESKLVFTNRYFAVNNVSTICISGSFIYVC